MRYNPAMPLTRKLLFFLAAIIAGLLVSELTVRAAGIRPGLSDFPPAQSSMMLIADERRGYGYRPGFTGRIDRGEVAYDVSINNIGMRDDPVADGEQIDILAAGSSFTTGVGVGVDEAWPSRLEQRLNESSANAATLRVLNAGISGYNLNQVRLSVEDFLFVDPELVVVGVVPAAMDRLYNPYEWFEGYAVRRHKLGLLKTTEDGFLVAQPNSMLAPATQHWLMENFRFAAMIWLRTQQLAGADDGRDALMPASTDEGMQRFLSEIDELNRFLQKKNVPLIVMIIGHQNTDAGFSEEIKRRNALINDHCDQQSIRCFDAVAALEAQGEQEPVFRVSTGDYHWSAIAHDRIATELAKFVTNTTPRSNIN